MQSRSGVAGGRSGPEQGPTTDWRLYGYRFSVYSRIVSIVLTEKGLVADWVEFNPFESDASKGPHPFGRVPVLEHGDLTIYETGAISRYIDRVVAAPALTPAGPKSAAAMDQVISLVDAYAYWPLVRQVFATRVFGPLTGEPADEIVVATGLAAAPRVLTALEALARDGRVLTGETVTLADCHLAPMIDYFQRAPEGAALLAEFPRLHFWWETIRDRTSIRGTDPGLPSGR